MKILSVAEDNLYNLWQLELQIYSFNKLGLSEHFVPIIIGRNDDPSEYASRISTEKQKSYYYKMGVVNFFDRPDYYPPAMQPFGTYAFLKENPTEESVLVIDVDVIFRDYNSFLNLQNLPSNVIYSPPTSYSRVDYYSPKGKNYQRAYKEMLQYLNLNEYTVKNFEDPFNDDKLSNASGHTILMPNPDKDYFKKVTKDSIVIHEILKNNSPEVKTDMSWMASVWAYYYNAIMLSQPFKATEHLNFCWAVSEETCTHPLIHMAGAMKDNSEKVFSKLDFMDTSPFNPKNSEKLAGYNTNNSSKPYVELVKEYAQTEPVCL